MNAYQQLLKALGGDTYENRRLINDFASHLGRVVRELSAMGGNANVAAFVIDPYAPEANTERWKKVVNMEDTMTDRQKADAHADIEKAWNT